MKKLTRKLANISMAAAILGTGATAAIIADAPKAEASAFIMDDFNGKNLYSSGLINIEQTVKMNDTWPSRGDYVLFSFPYDGGTFKHLKIYKVNDGTSTLQRYKTITEASVYHDFQVVESTVEITTGFPVGDYFGVVTTSKGQYRTVFFSIK